MNSAIVALGTTIGVVIFGTMAAYPLARYSFKGREFFYVIFATGLMFPLTVAILPLYLCSTTRPRSAAFGADPPTGRVRACP